MSLRQRAPSISQFAASHAIATLEARYDTKLFHWVGRRIELTDASHAFLADARSVLARAEAAELALSEFGNLKRRTLSVMASQTIASYWLPRHLVGFRAANPQIQIRLTIGNTAQVASAVETGAAELGFVEGAVENEDFVSVPVARDQMVVVVGPEHAWTSFAKLSPDDLMQGEWVMREPGSGTRSVFEDDLVRVGIEPRALRVVLELPSNEAVRAAVEAGLGATAISATVAAPSIEAGLLHQAPFRLPTREFHVLRHRERYKSNAAKELLALMAPRPTRHG